MRADMWHSKRRLSCLLMIASLFGTAPLLAQSPAPTNVAPLPFDHLLRYDELTTLLSQWAAARPNIVELTSVGVTPEGRKMWFLTLTSRGTGPALSKPAIVVDGNMHATEGGGGVAALHLAWRLIRDYGADPRVTQVLDTSCIYVLPRLTPDGVDAVLNDGRFIRSVNRPYPGDKSESGIQHRDIDGDKRPVFMRFRDPNGPWKISKADPRLMVPRDPDETGGEYWRVLPEGMITDYNGETIADPPALEPLDLGQNFPGDQGRANPGIGTGKYPTSEPEVAAYVGAIAKRPNIVAHVTCHTFGGLILTPPVNLGERLADSDVRTYATLAAKGASLTGYHAMTYLALRSNGNEAYIPSAFGWLFDRRGIYSFITEFWNPLRAAGIDLTNSNESAWLWGFHPVEDEVKMLRWSDEQLHGDGFIPWHPFHHPQLGDVEIGGWDVIRYWYNIPPERLEREVAPHTEWLIGVALSLPRLHVRSFAAVPVASGVWRVRLVVENTGWLPTNGSQQALDQGAVGQVQGALTLPATAHLVTGLPTVSLGQLQGRSAQRSTASWWSYAPGTPDRAMAEWFVAAPEGTKLSVTATHDRAGTVAAELVLKRSAGVSPTR